VTPPRGLFSCCLIAERLTEESTRQQRMHDNILHRFLDRCQIKSWSKRSCVNMFAVNSDYNRQGEVKDAFIALLLGSMAHSIICRCHLNIELKRVVFSKLKGITDSITNSDTTLEMIYTKSLSEAMLRETSRR
jgi:hypothetical protein